MFLRRSLTAVWVGVACGCTQAGQVGNGEQTALEPTTRTAFVGLVVTTRYHVLAEDGESSTVFPVRFTLDRDHPRTRFAECASRSLDVFAEKSSTSIWSKESKRKAETLREAYAACRAHGQLEEIRPVQQGFGAARSARLQEALLDSLTQLAHEISKQSLLKALYRDTFLGTVLPPEATILKIENAGLRGLRDELLYQVERGARADASLVETACRALGADALLFVSIERDEFATWPHPADVWRLDTRTLHVDALVLVPGSSRPHWRLRFEHSDSTALEALAGVGTALVAQDHPAEADHNPWRK